MKLFTIHSTSPKSSGFSLVELAVIVPILILMIVVLFESLLFMVKASGIERTTIATTYDVQNALSIIESDTVLASTFLPTTDASITDAYKPTTNSGNWSYIGDSLTSPTRVLILRAFNTSTNPQAASRQPSFLSANGCDTASIYTNDILQYNIIYFVDDGTLYRRRALDTTKPTCVTPYQKQSCPSLETLGLPNRDTTCQADDEVIARNVSAFGINYYAASNDSTVIDTYSELSDPESVTAGGAIEISLSITRKSYNEDVTSTSNVRVAKVNAPRIEN